MKFLAKAGSPAYEKMMELYVICKDANKTCSDFCKSIGATNVWLRHGHAVGGGLAAVHFESEPNKDWRKYKEVEDKVFYRPLRRTKAGKELAKKIENLPIVDESLLNEHSGCDELDVFLRPGYHMMPKIGMAVLTLKDEWEFTPKGEGWEEITVTEHNRLRALHEEKEKATA